MLLAGGQGSRLGVLTSDVAKPAVAFGGKYRIIDFPLSNCINSGIDMYCVQLFDKRFGNPLLGTIDNEVDATEMICRLYDIVCTHALALDSVNNEKSSQHQCCEDFA